MMMLTLRTEIVLMRQLLAVLNGERPAGFREEGIHVINWKRVPK
jgi:hypothetical protein